MSKILKLSKEEKLAENINYIAKVFCVSLLYLSYRIYTEFDLPFRWKIIVTALSSFGTFVLYVLVRLTTKFVLGYTSLQTRDEFGEELSKEIETAKESFEARIQNIENINVSESDD